jgi:hypothetical protein
MPTIIDSLLVTLGVDPKQFVKGAADANKAQKSIERQAGRTARVLTEYERKVADERKKYARESEEQAKRMAENIRAVRNELIGWLAVLTAGKTLKDFFGDTINEAAKLHFLSQNLRMSTEDLQAWQRAAERAGGSKEGMLNQLRKSAEDIAALRSGLGPSDAMQWFFRMGGSASDLKDGNTYLLARAQIIHDLFAKDPSRAALIAANMGISQDQFDLIKQGPSAILALVDAQKKNSAITGQDASAALALRNRWLDFKDSLQATTTKILVASIPAIEALVGWLQKLTQWVTENKDEIGRWASDVVAKMIPVLTDIGRALANTDWKATKDGIKEVGAAIIEIADSLREVLDLWNKWTGRNEKPTAGVSKVGPVRLGKKEDLKTDDAHNGRAPTREAPQAIKPGSFLAKVSDGIEMALARTLASFGNKPAAEFVRDKTGKDDYNAGPAHSSIVDKLIKMGWTREQAAGITASFDQESGLNPAARNPKSGAYGLAQWLGSRVSDFKKWSGRDLVGSSLDDQLGFFQYEVTKGKERAAGDALRAAKTAAEAARIHATMYERPDANEANIARRQSLAEAINSQMQKRDAPRPSAPPVAPDVASDSKTRAGGDLATLAGQLRALDVARTPALAALQPNASRSANVQTEVKIGQLVINTKATDAAGIARELPGELEKGGFGWVTQANTGIA